jgi:hypothetical protein
MMLLEYTNFVHDNQINLIYQNRLQDIPIYDLAIHDKDLFDYKNIAKLIRDLDYNYQ